jgi:hypothetical protein
MKKLIILSVCLLTLGLSAQCYKIDTVTNTSSVQSIANKPLLFGVQTTLEEIISKDYSLCDSGQIITADINSVAMPEQIVNIIGIQFLKRQYIVQTQVNMAGKILVGQSTQTIYVNAMFVEVTAIPHNKKAISKAIQKSLQRAVNTNK